jgi:polyhydroxybutyrate depolymerase
MDQEGYKTSKRILTDSTEWRRSHPKAIAHVGGLRRTYVVHLPLAYTPERAYPLVLAFHGRRTTARWMARRTHLSSLADEHHFIVVYPDGYKGQWGDGRGYTPSEREGVDDVAFIATLIELLRTQLPLDVRRIYATGISNGGFFSFRLGCLLADKIAAIAPVAATLPANLTATPPTERPVPLLLIHGTKDRRVPANGGVLRAGGQILSTTESAAFWARRNGCSDGAPITEHLEAHANDGTWVQFTRYPGCEPQASVELYTIVNGGHTWPGGFPYLPAMITGKTSRNLDASTVIWDFFEAHPMR